MFIFLSFRVGQFTIPTRNAQSLFAYLLLNAGQAQRRERLAGLLWPDSSEENARSNLRHELWRLRKALETNEESYFLIDDLSLSFNPFSPYNLDVQNLESGSIEGSTADDLITALAVYRGELLPGFYDEWVLAKRDRLHALFEAKMARLVELLQADGRWAEVLEWSLRWIEVGQWPEPAYRALMSAYANSGDISKAVATYERLVSKARLVTITGSGGVGKTRLAIQVAAALATQFRDGVQWIELAALSIVNPSRKREFGDWKGSREELSGMELVAQSVAKALRVPESPSAPILAGVLEHLRDRRLLLVLDNCEHLIAACATLTVRILEDCPDVSILTTSREALGVPGEKAWLLPSLSLPEPDRTSEFGDIAQSEVVSLFIERTTDLLPAYQPDEVEAATIAQICRRLDGIPLAIELAAARMNLLSAREIAGWLDHRFNLLTAGNRTALPRHQTLRAAIEWSYDLLNQDEQALFRHLSIFAGSFNLKAAQAVCSDEEIQPDEILNLLGRLLDKSLLQVDPSLRDTGLATRYRFLDTICSFGRLKLDEAGEARRMRDQHAAYFVRLVEGAGPELLLSNQEIWYKLLQAENDNIRAVIEWSAESDQAESALRIVGALLWFWWSHGSIQEGLDLALKALALPSAGWFPEYRARALNTAGYIQWTLGDITSARQSLDEALSILKNSNDETSLVWLKQSLGLVLAAEGQYDLADAALQDAVAIARKLGDLTKSSFSLAFMGDNALQQGDRSKAKRIYQESADLLRALGNKLFVAYPLRRLGYFALERDDILQARSYFRESLVRN
jgi:pentatricopeptide repeat protein